MKNKWIFITIAVLIVIGLAIGIPVYINTSGNYVAKVNGEKITKSEFEMYMLMFREQMEYGQTFADDNARRSFWESQVSGGESMEQITKSNIIQYLREQKISISKAKEEKVELTADETASIKDQVNSIIEQNFSGKRIDADKYYKQAYGVTLAQYEQYMKNDMLSQKYKSLIADTLRPSDQEVSQTFEQNKTQYDKVSVRHILFLTQDATTGQALSEDLKQQAKKKADDMLAKVNAGEDMKALAIANSEDTGISQNEGEYIFDKYGMYDKAGTFTEFTMYSSLDQDFMNWSLSAKVGDTGIVETQFGYHVMKLESRAQATFDTIKSKISNELTEQKLTSEVENWKKDDKYNVEIKDEIYNQMRIV